MNETISCVVCYEDNNPCHALICCDSNKKICSDCINCLRTPQCPYCRQELSDTILSNNTYIHSAPPPTTNWTTMLEEELLINPFDPEFQDSRILRRQIRRMRRRYISEQNRNNPQTNRITSRTRRANRRAERHLLRNSVRLNNRNLDLQFELEL
jgi:hypothetical protein